MEKTDKEKLNELMSQLLKLRDELSKMNELDWFYNISQYIKYEKLEHIGIVRDRVEHVAGGLAIVYLFAVFETFFDNKLWEDYIDRDDIKLLRAYRYVRHCVAHSCSGAMVKPEREVNKKEYQMFVYMMDNETSKASQKFRNLIKWDKTENKITIDNSAGLQLKNFMMKLTQDAIASVGNKEMRVKS